MAVAAAPATGQPSAAKVSDVIASFRPTKLFRLAKQNTSITSLDFDDSGEFLLAACDDESLQLYNCKEGKHVKTLLSQKYGAHLARFTHHAQSVIYSSTKVDDGIRYLSTHDNQFLRYFKGHTAPVTCLTLSPSSDNFMSCSLDNTVKLWDLSSSHPQGELRLHGAYFSAYDPSATVIAIASPSTSSILLYDLRNYDKPPFATFDLLSTEKVFAPQHVGHPGNSYWTKLEFSNDGKSLLIATNGPGHYLLDAFDGHVKAFIARRTGSTPPSRLAPGGASSNPNSQPPPPAGQGDACFSPDGRYIIGGAGPAGDMVVWDAHASPGPDKKLRPVAELLCKGRPAAVVEYNPRLNLIASADRELVFWLPDPEANVGGGP
ncbi:MAG: hypothetical protein M1819_000309 [Sarea resinae]|nr:MAG: hypothetical protein M1819_000309 [Sarea resinae]